MDYRREIDGLRALAVLPVILFHAGFETFSGGFVGVDVFFVISGYLITVIILADLEQGKFSIVSFYERRARRILPALYLVMLVSIPFAWFWLLPSDMKYFAKSLVAVSVFISNISFRGESGYFDAAAELKPLLHTWSLAVEEQYYLFFPVFLMLFWKLGKRWVLVALGVIFVASLYEAQWAVYKKPTAAFYLLSTRGWELLIGAFAAFYLSQANRKEFGKGISELCGWSGVALILYAVFAYSKSTPFPGFYALVPTLGTALVILFANQRTTVGKFIGNKAFVGIGLISYSAYLWHQPLFAFARHRSLTEPSDLAFLGLILGTLLLAYLSWKYVESYYRNKSYVSRRGIFLSSFLMTLVFLCFGLFGYYSNGHEYRFDSEYERFTLAQNDRNPRQSECYFSADTFPKPEDYCVLGAGKVIGLLLGDSHADALAHSLSDALGKNKLALKSVTYTGCPPVADVYRVEKSEQHKCHEINKQSFDYALNDSGIEYVVLLGRWSIYLEGTHFNNREGGVEFGETITFDKVVDGVKQKHQDEVRVSLVAAQYKASVERLLNAGKKVVLIYPIPEVGFDVPKTLARMKMFGVREELTTSYDVFLERNRRTIDAFDAIVEHRNLIRIRPDQLFCRPISGGRCITIKDERILYYDDDHLSNAGSTFVADKVVKAMLRLK